METVVQDTPTASSPPPPAHQEEGRAEVWRRLRETKLQEDLQKLDARHEEERQTLSQKLRELAIARKTIQDQVLADWPFSDLGPGHDNLTPKKERKLSAELSREGNRRLSQQEDGASSSAGSSAGAALNGKEEGLGEGDEEIPTSLESFLKASQQRDKEKQTLLKELLPEKNQHVEVQRLLEVLDKEELRKVYERRINTEDPDQIKAYQQHKAATRAGLWRFVSKQKVEAKRELVEQEGTAEEDICFVDEELGFPKLPESYEEIKKLLDIEKNPIFSRALQEWNRKEELFSRRVERKKNRVASLKNEVYQLIGFFSVFQGVVLTAVSQSSLLHCYNNWSPIALSVLASVISTFGVLQKLNQIHDLQRNIDSEERSFTAAVKVGQRLREPGLKGIDFSRLSVEIDSNLNRKSKFSKKRHVACLYSVVVILTLFAFGVLFPVSFWRILCKPGATPAPAA